MEMFTIIFMLFLLVLALSSNTATSTQPVVVIQSQPAGVRNGCGVSLLVLILLSAMMLELLTHP